MKMRGMLIAAMLLIIPSVAFAARGVVTDEVAMRAGPGTGFPVVDRLPAGAHVVIHGCLKDNSWCDVSWNEDRGWVSAEYLEYYFRNRYVYLPNYVDTIDVPVVPFVLGRYWTSHYAAKPFYDRRTHWNHYWQSHARFATHPPRAHAPGVVITEGRGAVREERGARAGFANERALREERAGRVNGARGAIAGERQSFIGRERGGDLRAREHQRRFSAAPANAPQVNGREMSGRRGEFARTHEPAAGPQHGNRIPEKGRFSAGHINAPAARPDARHFGGVNAGPAAGHIGGAPAARFSGAPSRHVGGVPSGRVGGTPMNAQAAAPRAMATPHPGAGAPRMIGAPGGGAPMNAQAAAPRTMAVPNPGAGAPRMGGTPGGGGAHVGGPAGGAAAAAGGQPGRHR